MLDSIMGAACMLFLVIGAASFVYFAIRAIEELIKTIAHKLAIASAKLEVDIAYSLMQESASLKNVHRYAIACGEYYRIKYEDSPLV